MDEITPIIKGVFAGFPVGSSLVTWWNERETQKRDLQLDSFMNWAKEEFERLSLDDKRLFDKEYLKSEEFKEVMFRIIGLFIDEQSSIKRNAYKNILLNSASTLRPSYLINDQYIHLIEQTSTTEISLLSFIFKKQENLSNEARQTLFEKGLPKASIVTVSEVSNLLNIHEVEVLNISWSLIGRGLLFAMENNLSYSASIVITPFGANFCRFILHNHL